MREIGYFLRNPHEIAQGLVRKLCANTVKDDRQYLGLLYLATFGRRINWDNPKTFNEKLNWIKIYDRNPIYTSLADKYAVKQYVAEKIGVEYVVENYGVYDKWSDIDFSKLPNQFVIKCTHDSGGAFVCRDKNTFDYEGVRHRIESNLAMYNYNIAREWPYKNVPHRIIIDKFLDDHTGSELRDYKFWCFNGRPVYMYCTVKAKEIYENFYDMDFNPVMIDHGFPRHQPEFSKPDNFEIMKQLATVLSEGISFVRVDFFDVDGHVYFGECTFFDWGAKRPFKGNWDEELGRLMSLPLRK